RPQRLWTVRPGHGTPCDALTDAEGGVGPPLALAVDRADGLPRMEPRSRGLARRGRRLLGAAAGLRGAAAHDPPRVDRAARRCGGARAERPQCELAVALGLPVRRHRRGHAPALPRAGSDQREDRLPHGAESSPDGTRGPGGGLGPLARAEATAAGEPSARKTVGTGPGATGIVAGLLSRGVTTALAARPATSRPAP